MEKTINNTVSISTEGIVAKLKSSYVVIVLSVLGVCALATAILVSWPALAYLASVLFV